MGLERILTSQLAQHVGQRVLLKGWLHRLRKMGEVNFLVVRDRSGVAQAVLSPESIEPLKGLQSETVLSLEGEVVATPQAPGGYELHHCTVEVISPVENDIPFALYKNRVRANTPTFLDHAVIGHRAIERRALLRISSG